MYNNKNYLHICQQVLVIYAGPDTNLSTGRGTRILITENTFKSIGPVSKAGTLGHCDIEEVDTVKVKGKENEIKIFA